MNRGLKYYYCLEFINYSNINSIHSLTKFLFMITLMISHEVNNFEEWKKQFEANEPMRAEAGIKFTGLYQAHDNPNMVTVTSEANDVAIVTNFMAQAGMKEIMEKAGVISAPEVKIMTKVN